jgi:hypothetical protein
MSQTESAETGPAPPSKHIRHDVRIHTVEALAGFCLACILTLAFMSPLSAIGKWSFCIFSAAFPIFVLTRIQLRNPRPLGTLVDNMLLGAAVASAFALILLVWSVYWLAAVLLFASGVTALAIIFRASRTAKATTKAVD